jgi:SAM-dependent methyltransferase
MSLRRQIKRVFHSNEGRLYRFLDRFYVPLDRKQILRTRNIRLIPREGFRRGGKRSYAEWAHVIGIFQTLMCLHLDKHTDLELLDVGCGTGLLGIAAEPFLAPKGHYVGLDVNKKDIDFCRRHYPMPTYEFVHFDVNNPAYAPAQTHQAKLWPLSDGRFDLVTALSVWTHLNEADACFYFAEVARVLKPGGKALITFFLLDDAYQASVPSRLPAPGRYHMTSQSNWVFDRPAYGSDAWRYPNSANIPEEAMGITTAGLERLLAQAPLALINRYPGNWKEIPGVYFQDVLTFEKRR